MAKSRLSDYAVGNARPGGLSPIDKISPELARRVEGMVAQMPPELQARFQVISGFRSPERQAQVNPGVTNSRHSHGAALDLGNDPAVLSWISQNGGQYGLGFPLAHMPREQNHLEMLDAAGKRAPVAYAASPAPGVSTGLGKFGVADANLPVEPAPMPALAPPPATTQPAPAEPALDPEALRAAASLNNPFARGPLGTSLADAFVNAAQTPVPTPTGFVPDTPPVRATIPLATPLGRRLR